MPSQAVERQPLGLTRALNVPRGPRRGPATCTAVLGIEEPRFETTRQQARRPGSAAAIGISLGLAMLPLAGGADGRIDVFREQLSRTAWQAAAWYTRTPPLGRVSWGGMLACAAAVLAISVRHSLSLRRSRVAPAQFTTRLLARFRDGKLDRLKALDLCAMHPSPAARIVKAAAERWERPIGDVERAAASACLIESTVLRGSLDSLRRIAVISLLLGLLGTLASLERLCLTIGINLTASSLGPSLAATIPPLMTGVALAILATATYDGLASKFQALANALERLCVETVDGISMSRPAEAQSFPGRMPGVTDRGSFHVPAPHPAHPASKRAFHRLAAEGPEAGLSELESDGRQPSST